MPSVPPALLGSSRLMTRVCAQIAQLAKFPFPVRLEGPSGSGKGVAARVIHALSPRAARTFFVCSLAMLSDGTDLDDLVGHKRGAFTHAIEDRQGAFEEAQGGTLFLDEVGEATPQAQKYLLRLLDEKTTRRKGQNRDLPLDVRVIFATNRSLEAEVLAGRFRPDLLARMGVLTLRMPALAEHREDIPELAEHFLAALSCEAGCATPSLSADTLARLTAYSWPLNVRELQDVMMHYLVYERLPEAVQSVSIGEQWREEIDTALTRHGGNVTAAARELGVCRQTLHQELRRRRRDA